MAITPRDTDDVESPAVPLAQTSMRWVVGVQIAVIALSVGVLAVGRGDSALVTSVAGSIVLGCTSVLYALAVVREGRLTRPAVGWALLAAAHLLLAVNSNRWATAGQRDVALYGGYCPFVLAAVWLLLRAAVPQWRSGLWRDAAIVGLSVLAVGATGLWAARPAGPSWSAATASPAVLTAAALIMVAALVLSTAALTGAQPGRTAWWLSGGLVLLAGCQTVTVAESTHGGAIGGVPGRTIGGVLGGALAVGWLVGYAVMGMATAPLRRGAAVIERRGAPAGRRRSRDLPNLFVAASAVLIGVDVAGGPVPTVASVLALTALCIAVVRPAQARRRVREALSSGARPSTDLRTDLRTEVGALGVGALGDELGTDRLTGLANRQALSEALASDGQQDTLAAERWSGWTDRIALLLVDLDRFKEVNEAFGHEVGDQVLAQVGTRLRAVLRPNQLLARLGGDEFAVVLPGAGEVPATRVAQTLRAQLTAPVEIQVGSGVESVYVQASVGVATCRLPRGNPEDLLRQADVAVYRAKESGGGIELFDPEHDRRGAQRLRRIGELRTALEHGDLEVYLQPQVDLATGRVCGTEALARWRHPKDGVLLPAAFLPLAAQTGLMRPVAPIVVDLALAACAQWWSRGHRIPVSVNLSADDLRDGDLTDRIPAWPAAHGLPHRALRIEITEDVLLTDPASVAALLERWRRVGIAVALDDYGTGYSSLAYLRELPIDELKLDRVFVGDLQRSTTMTIVSHTIAMAHGLHMHVVAEGVENQATASALADLGCDVGQGLYFGAAMDLPAFLAHLQLAARRATP